MRDCALCAAGFSRAILLVVALLVVPCPAPVPRCSPMIVINKLVEWNSLTSDSNPYFPVPPCEYGGPLQAIKAGDYKSVFVLDQPHLVPRHNLYEFVWFLKTGYTRLLRMLQGKEKFQYDLNILREGYSHTDGKLRTTQLGHDTIRRPEILEDRNLYVNVVGEKTKQYWMEGPDKVPTKYSPEGLLVLPPDKEPGVDEELLGEEGEDPDDEFGIVKE